MHKKPAGASPLPGTTSRIIPEPSQSGHACEIRVRSELERTQIAIQQATGQTPTKVRPPYGAGGWPGHYDRELARVAANLGLSIHNWDVDTEDWRAPAGLGAGKLKAIRNQLTAMHAVPA
ncbi:MAG: polysaccharide deacetylase family protein [Thiolinea sp.]